MMVVSSGNHFTNDSGYDDVTNIHDYNCYSRVSLWLKGSLRLALYLYVTQIVFHFQCLKLQNVKVCSTNREVSRCSDFSFEPRTLKYHGVMNCLPTIKTGIFFWHNE